ncbi:MAG: PEP-CTERM sorting domain-containing protein [Puniceicoccales bacterium]
MKLTSSLSLLLLGSITSSVSATTYFIDFNDADTSGTSSVTWNTYGDPADLVSSNTLLDETGSTSSIYITATGNIDDSFGTNLSNPSTRPAWLSEFAADDFFWTGNDSDNNEVLSFTTTFGGLTSGDIVSLDVFAARTSSLVLEANYEYSLDGGTTWYGFEVVENDGTAATTDGWDSNTTQTALFNLDEDGGYEDGRYMNVSDVTLISSTLDVKVTVPVEANYAGINAMQLTVIPEPASFAIITGLLPFGFLALRRRRQ